MANECLGCKANWYRGGWGASVGVLMMHRGNEIGQTTGKKHMRFFGVFVNSLPQLNMIERHLTLSFLVNS